MNSRITHHASRITHHASRITPSHNPTPWILAITLLAFALRVWQLDAVPPGWRDDELIETLVISQKVLDGELAVFYPDASGHEALFHVLKAGLLAVFGPNALSIRWLSAIFGTLTIPFTYILGSRLFGRQVGLVAAAALTVSFWSLMYSRFGVRHISMPLFMLATFYAFLRAIEIGNRRLVSNSLSTISSNRLPITGYVLAGLFMGLGFYTYFAARGVPLILLAFCGYLWLFQRPLIQRHWRGLLLMFGLALLLALPLIITLRQQPEAEARVTEVGWPLVEALEGNFDRLAENTIRTLNMFHSDGDDEWLYNIPFRPLFGPIGAAFFWSGVLIALWHTLKPIWLEIRSMRHWSSPAPLHPSSPAPLHPHPPAAAFLLLWWLAGITPGFLSIPAGSLSHTIAAQPAVYILAALPILTLSHALRARTTCHAPRITYHVSRINLLTTLLTLLLLASITMRDLPDYFQRWPERGMVRFLYRADIQDLAYYLNQRPELTDFGVTSLLAGPWDKLALEIDLQRATAAYPRWYNPERAILLRLAGEPALSFSGYPLLASPYAGYYAPIPGEAVGGYQLAQVASDFEPAGEPICFQNGFCSLAAAYDPLTGRLELAWLVDRPLDLPPMPLISNPPPPGLYAGPRLVVFGHLLDEQGNLLAVDDGFWVDPASLQPGDLFLQQHWLETESREQATFASFGLYDPMTGQRLLTEDGRDQVRLGKSEWWAVGSGQ